MRKILPLIPLLLSTLIVLVFFAISQQELKPLTQTVMSSSPLLAYVKSLPDGSTRINFITANGEGTGLSVLNGECYSFSGDLGRIAISEQHGRILRIYELPLGRQISTVSWQWAEQSQCSFSLVGKHGERISFIQRQPTYEIVNIDAITGETLSRVPIKMPANVTGDAFISMDSSALGYDFARVREIVGDRMFYRVSPNGRFMVYAQCPPSADSSPAECRGQESYILYDLEHERVVETLRLPPATLPPNTVAPWIMPNWSPTGRYVAYSYSWLPPLAITIYDTVQKTYVDTSAIALLGDWGADRLTWSADDQKIAFSLYSSNNEPHFSIGVFNLITHEFMDFSQSDSLNNYSAWVEWMPDNQALAVLTDGELTRLTLDGTLTPISNDVQALLNNY